MKNRRFAIIAFILCACFALTVGFAAIQETLAINGNLKTVADSSNFVVKFTNATAEAENGSGQDITIGSGTATFVDHTASIDCEKLALAGDKLTVVYTITNASKEGIKAQVTVNDAVVTNNNANGQTNSYYDVTVDWTPDTSSTYATLDVGETLEVTVTVVLNTTPAFDAAATFAISITADAIN
jgi:hypothetical protein